jgi:hypothetical protein
MPSTREKWVCAEKRETANRSRAGDGIRTHDNNVGNVVLYQLSYARIYTCATGLPNYRLDHWEARALPYDLGRLYGYSQAMQEMISPILGLTDKF